jgi:CDP-2,3-bis-(O-geranylgeranyl)-sn-glycerol synthase
MILLILESIFFALPIYVANGCASLSRSIPKLREWDTPVDLGLTLKGERLLGKGKTFRGFVFGTLYSLLVGLAQYYITKQVNFNYLVLFNDISLSTSLLLALLQGFGGLVGDTVKSFFKRRIGIKSGRPWPPFDQLDFLIGGVAFGALIYIPEWKVLLVLFIITPLAHFLTNVMAYVLGLKDVWW